MSKDNEPHIPYEFFQGWGQPDMGICTVFFSEDVIQFIEEYTYQPTDLGEVEHRMASPFASSDEAATTRLIVQKDSVDDLMREFTGYTFEQMTQWKHQLTDEYRGKTEAPFEIDIE